MKFTAIRECQFGYRASVGDRSVEVLRTFPGDWFIYAQINGRTCKSLCDQRRPMSYSECMREARNFLNHKITYEVWP